MSPAPDGIGLLERSERRMGAVSALAEGRRERRDPRRIVGSALVSGERDLGDFEDRRWVHRVGSTCEPTPPDPTRRRDYQ